MSRPTAPAFNPPLNGADNFGRRTREAFLLLDDVVNFRDEMNTYQSGTRIIPNLLNSLEIPNFENRKNGEPFVYDGTKLTYENNLYHQHNGLVFETNPQYIDGGSSIRRDFNLSSDVSIDTTNGYRSINIGTQTLSYPEIGDNIEMNLHFAVRVPGNSTFFTWVQDGNTDYTGLRILNGDTLRFGSFESSIGSFTSLPGGSTSITGGGIYFFRFNIPGRSSSSLSTTTRQFNVSWVKYGLDDYETAFAPENNYNFNEGTTRNFTGSDFISSTDTRMIYFQGSTTGTRLFHAKLELGNPRNGL